MATESRTGTLRLAAREAERAGKWLDAAAAHARLAHLEPHDVEHRVRLGHAFRRAGRADAAADAYLLAAHTFADQDEFEKAIACALLARAHRRGDGRIAASLTEWRARRRSRLAGVPSEGATFQEPDEWRRSRDFTRRRAAAADEPLVDSGEVDPFSRFDAFLRRAPERTDRHPR